MENLMVYSTIYLFIWTYTFETVAHAGVAVRSYNNKNIIILYIKAGVYPGVLLRVGKVRNISPV